MDKLVEVSLANLILPLVKDLVLPKIESTIQKYSLKNINSNKVENSFDEYLSRRYQKFLIIDTLTFPNKQTFLNDLYEPLTIKGDEGNEENLEIRIDKYPDELLPKYQKIIIEDTAGMGKSTISKKLFTSIVEQQAGIPVLIELSQISNKNSILKEIQCQLSPIGRKISQDFILKLINEGEFIFLFDGFDEIALNNRDYAIREVHNFVEKASVNYFLITSRPEDSLVSFGDFQKFSVKPLDEYEAFSLLRRYDTYGYKAIAEKFAQALVSSVETGSH